MADVWANFMACHPRVTCHIAGCCNLTNSVSWSQNCVSHCRVLPPGEFNGMSSQRHVSHCRVLPLGEFTVMIPKPHATLQGVIIPSAILDIVFRRILFIVIFLNAVGELQERFSQYLKLVGSFAAELRTTAIFDHLDIVKSCQEFFGFELPSTLLSKRIAKFESMYYNPWLLTALIMNSVTLLPCRKLIWLV